MSLGDSSVPTGDKVVLSGPSLAAPPTNFVEICRGPMPTTFCSTEVPTAFPMGNAVFASAPVGADKLAFPTSVEAFAKPDVASTISLVPVKADAAAVPEGLNAFVNADGTVTLADGLKDGKRLGDYKVGFAEGTDPAMLAKGLDELQTLVHGKAPNVDGPTLKVGEDAQTAVPEGYVDKFNKKFQADPTDPNEKLPDNPPQVPPGKGGTNPDCGPQPKPPDAPPDNTPPDGGPDGADAGRSGKLDQMLRRLTQGGGDMHPVYHGNWMANTLFSDALRNRILQKLLKGEPLTDADLKDMGDELANPANQTKIKDGLESQAASLDKQAAELTKAGKTTEAKALTDQAAGVRKFNGELGEILKDDTKRAAFVQSLGSFMNKAGKGEANPSDVHALFNNNPALEQFVRRAVLGKAAGDDIDKLTPEQMKKIVESLLVKPAPPTRPTA